MSKVPGLMPWEACARPTLEKLLDSESLAYSNIFTSLKETPGGPILSVPGPGSHRVVINSVETAFQLLDKPNFSDRPHWPMAELLGRDQNVGFLPYGKRLQQCRRILSGAFKHSAVQNHWKDLLEFQSTELVRCLLSSPNTFFEDVQA